MIDPFKSEALRSSETERRRAAEHGRLVRAHLARPQRATAVLADALRAAADRLDRRTLPAPSGSAERAHAHGA
ncbi:MAG TPA: hypothetical protein VLX89_04705 [Actinomycetota bacterium]|nr:hypothetical protein [Actinomycetota bacterium]